MAKRFKWELEIFLGATNPSYHHRRSSKNEGLESGFEADRLGKAVHGFPSGRYFKKVDQCLLALFFPDVAGVSSKNMQQAGPSRERRRRNEKAYLDGQYHKEVSFFLLRVLKTKPVKLLNFHFCHFLSRLTRETKLWIPLLPIHEQANPGSTNLKKFPVFGNNGNKVHTSLKNLDWTDRPDAWTQH